MGRKKRNILRDIRDSISPRKKRNDDSQKVKGYSVIRVPESLKRDLDVLKMAYEIMWSDRGDPSNLSTEELETWVMQRMTQEVFFRRLYQGALRIDPKVKEYLPRAEAAYESVRKFDGQARAAAEKAVRDLEKRSRKSGTSLVDEARKEKEKAKESLERLRNETPYIAPSSPIDASIIEMAGTVSMPTERELQEDPRLREAFGKEVKEKERHQLQYFFVKGEDRLPARFSKGPGTFAVTFEDQPRGVTFMTNRGWHLEDELGNIVDNKTATDIKREYENSQSTNNTIPVISEQYSDEDMAAWAGISVEEYKKFQEQGLVSDHG